MVIGMSEKMNLPQAAHKVLCLQSFMHVMNTLRAAHLPCEDEQTAGDTASRTCRASSSDLLKERDSSLALSRWRRALATE